MIENQGSKDVYLHDKTDVLASGSDANMINNQLLFPIYTLYRRVV